MAEAVVHIGENSPEHVAHKMTLEILLSIEGKKWGQFTRDEFLKTLAQCLKAMGRPHGTV